MKMAYITFASLTDDWAHSVQIVNMCKAFADNGADVTLIVPFRKVFSKVDLFDHYKIKKTFKVLYLPSIDLFYKNPSKFLYWLRFLSFYISARFYIFLNYFDVIYSRDLYSAIFFPNVIIEQHTFPRVKTLIHNFIYSYINKIITLTTFVKKNFEIIGISSENVLVAGSGVDIDSFNHVDSNELKITGIQNGDYVFGYIGTLKTMGMEKGVSNGVESLKYLPQKFKFLVVGGEPNDIDYYKKLSKDLNVSDRVIFVGKVNHSEISKYNSVCNIFIAPFPENTHFNYYMSPLKIFEYMASKKPIISTTLPSILEVLKDGVNSILINPGDSKMLADAIMKIEKDKLLANNLINKAFADVQLYSWDNRAKKILNFIKS